MFKNMEQKETKFCENTEKMAKLCKNGPKSGKILKNWTKFKILHKNTGKQNYIKVEEKSLKNIKKIKIREIK